ncbi:hypothetical protein AB0903_08150 [Streptomyces sp. NPDC048389]|uniref:hypothetical protein n=1 Tax=Streptomyces sp. NPDC048389 TaxID=3154622 RepID=UPI00345622E7
MALTVPAPRGPGLMPPTAEVVLAYAADQTVKAAQSLWPHSTVQAGEVAPSVTSYVQRVQVDGRPLYGKLPILGASLVSVLRGARGDWATVKAAQAAYAQAPDSLVRREGQQLMTLAAAGVRVPRVAGCAGGVLFTEPVPGPTLGELIAREPHRTALLLGRVADQIGRGLTRPGVAARVDRVAIRERSITDTFQRKFAAGSRTYLRDTGHGELLGAVIGRLREVPVRPAPFQPVIYGDLKPEHAVFPSGPDGPVVFLDPGLQRGRPCADVAKVVSRTVLGLVAEPLPPEDARAVLSGITAFTARLTAEMEPDDQEAWLRQFLLLWVMDTVNILTTYLSAPAGLPLSAQAAAVVERAEVVCQMLEHATVSMASRAPARSWWRVCLDDAVCAVVA